MSASRATGVAWRTDGYWTLSWLRIWFRLTSGQRMNFPPRGFVGKVSLSSAATALPKCRLLSTRLRPAHCTHDARLWQLTCVWLISLQGSPRRRRGRSWVSVGSLWETVGVDDSDRPT